MGLAAVQGSMFKVQGRIFSPGNDIGLMRVSQAVPHLEWAETWGLLSNLANLADFLITPVRGNLWRGVHGFWLPEFCITCSCVGTMDRIRS